MLFPGALDERAVSDDRKRRAVPENRPAITTVSYHSAHPHQSTASPPPLAMKPHRYERSVIEQCRDCGRLFTDRHPDCPDDNTDEDQDQ